MESEIDRTPGLPAWEVTFMERLQRAGYRTGAVGKIHMMPQKGFHHERLCGGKGARWTESEGSALGPGPLGAAYASWLEARHPGGYEAIYAQRRRPEYRDQMTAIRNVLPLEEYVDYWIAEEAIEFLSDPGSRPFFLWCGFCGPHPPVDPPAPYDALYAPDQVPLPKQRQDEPPASPKGRPRPGWSEAGIRRWIAYYWGLLSLIDDQVGRIVDALEKRGLLENTLVAFVSDHGEMAGDFNMMGKGNFYEEVIRVPLIVVPPGGGSPARIDELVEVFDLAPTFLDCAGVEIPGQMQATSLRPLLEGTGVGREAVFCEYATNDRARQGLCARTDRYKLVFWGRGEPGEFYDLREDPDELCNLYGDPGHRAEADRHEELMLDWLLRCRRFYFRDETPNARELRIWL
jgi:arylsulfatase A-like enzyme